MIDQLECRADLVVREDVLRVGLVPAASGELDTNGVGSAHLDLASHLVGRGEVDVLDGFPVLCREEGETLLEVLRTIQRPRQLDGSPWWEAQAWG